MSDPIIGTPTPEEHEVLMASPDARDARQAAERAELSVYIGMPVRGQRRGGHFETGEIPPPPYISGESLKALVQWHIDHKVPLKDNFTRGYNPPRKSIGEYALGGWVKWSYRGKTDEEIAEFKRRMERRPQYIEDNLQREVWHRVWNAELRRTALKHVSLSARVPFEPTPLAVHLASDAVENFGLCLQQNHEGLDVTEGAETLGLAIENIGAWFSNRPDFAKAYLNIFEIVNREQNRRYQYHHEILEGSRLRGNRQTAIDSVREQEVQAMFSELREYRPPEATS